MENFYKAKNRNFLKGLTHDFGKKKIFFAKKSLKIEFLDDLEY